MAMAKFVFRSLAREHPEPGDFLASANDVVVDEIAPGKFITMAYLAVDGMTGDGRLRERRPSAAARSSCPTGSVARPRRARARARHRRRPGIRGGARRPAAGRARRRSTPTASIEARRDGELYGVERLDALLAANRDAAAARARASPSSESCRASPAASSPTTSRSS